MTAFSFVPLFIRNLKQGIHYSQVTNYFGLSLIFIGVVMSFMKQVSYQLTLYKLVLLILVGVFSVYQ